MIALIYSLVGTTAGKIGALLLVLCLMTLPSVYFQAKAVSLERSLEAKTLEVVQAKASLSQLQAMADEQRRSLTAVYASAQARNKKLAKDLANLRKNPPPAGCEGSMQWLRDKAQEMKP